MDEHLPDWIETMKVCGHATPRWMIDHVRRLGEPARASLVAILRDTDPAEPQHRTGGSRAVHVVVLLAEFAPDDALVDDLIARLHSHPHSHIAHGIADTLSRFGPRVAPPLLAALARLSGSVGADGDAGADGADAKAEARHLVSALARCGARSEEVFAALSAAVRRFPAQTTGALGHYGDVRLIPLLRAAIDGYDPDAPDPDAELWEDDVVFGAQESVEMLGGTLTEDQLGKVDEVEERLGLEDDDEDPDAEDLDDGFEDDEEEEEPFEALPRPSPNAPCWCGSGRKYKKCHQAGDDERR